MVVQVAEEILVVDSVAAHPEIGGNKLAVAAAVDTQEVPAVTSSAAAVVVVLITMELHKQIFQVQTTQLDS